jgi:ribosomal protein S12 methylthiotransferase accessory factor
MLERARAGYLGRAGLIGAVKQILRAPGEPRLHSVTALPANTAVYTHGNLIGQANAAGFTLEHAMQCAIGECLERYSCLHYDADRLVRATQQALGDDAIGFDEFGVYAGWQYDAPGWPFARFRPDVPVSWVEGKSWLTGRRRFVPACLVYVPYRPRERADLLALSVSSGQACHPDLEQAVLTGLYEVVERDAFMISWLRRLPLPRVLYQDDAVLGPLWRRHFADDQLEYHLFDMTLDVALPTYLCLVEGRTARGPMFGMGAATRIAHRDAAAKALLEAGQDLIWCRDLVRRDPGWRLAPGGANIREFQDHVRLYCEPEMAAELAFLTDSPRRRALPAPDADRAPPARPALEHALRCLDAQGLDCVVVDTTAADVAAAGFHAPKVIIPGLVMLTADHRLQALGSPRLRTVPAKLGIEALALPGLNPTPHPFP